MKGGAKLLALLVVVLPLLRASPAAAEQDDDGGRFVPALTLALEYDTNARRLPFGSIGGDGALALAPKDDIVGDGLLRAQASLSALQKLHGVVLRADAAAGLKIFAHLLSERMAVAQGTASLQAPMPLGFFGTLSATAKARGQQSGVRTYALARTDAVLWRPLGEGLSLRAGLAGSTFHAFDNALFTSSSTEGSVGGAWAFTSAERVDVVAAAGLRAFPLALPAPLDPATQAVVTGRRLDAPLTLVVSATSARRVFLSSTYSFERNASNSRGESFFRHRFSALVGFRLPEQITATGRGTLQLTSYDSGVSLGQQYFLGDDEENQNNLELMLSRPFIGGLTVEGRLFWMGNELAREGARFSRATASIGVRAEL